MRWGTGLALAVALAGFASGAVAQDREATLADIRQQLAVLYVDVQRLEGELSTTGAPQTTGGNTPLERLAAIEAELQRLTAKTEQLEFRINRITVDGTNRIGDLEFRLCELEADCDIAMLGDTPSLGGVDSAAQVPVAEPSNDTGGPALAVGEQADFDAAKTALNEGQLQAAVDRFGGFIAAYPGSPLSGEAYYLRGEALEGLGQLSGAARSYLDSFSGEPDGAFAPDALFKLGTSLAALGQVQDACVTLREVSVRFPSSEAVFEANSAMQELGCG